MGGILSPDGESVLHESKWVEAILSPDESMYYYEGEWYSLNEEITSAIPVVIKPPPKRPEYKVEDIRGNDGDASSGKILATIAGLFLLWLIFDSGNIVSYADLASMECSALSDFDSFVGTNTQNECMGVQNEALAIVLGAGLGVLLCLMYILSNSSTEQIISQKSATQEEKAEAKAAKHLQAIQAATLTYDELAAAWHDDDLLWEETKFEASKRPQLRRCNYWDPDKKKSKTARCSNSITGGGDYCETHSQSMEKT